MLIVSQHIDCATQTTDGRHIRNMDTLNCIMPKQIHTWLQSSLKQKAIKRAIDNDCDASGVFGDFSSFCLADVRSLRDRSVRLGAVTEIPQVVLVSRCVATVTRPLCRESVP